jgi:predicted ATP-grasp superfamily ATP-dependent carboligase
VGTGEKSRTVYFQEYIQGESCAAVFVGNKSSATLLGVTRQLVGERWLHAKPFAYCGSIGPLNLEPATDLALDRLGSALARGCDLRGLFGVDYVLHDVTPWPVEVNPRYTASTEVLEYATGVAALSCHRRVFEPSTPEAAAPRHTAPHSVVGKAILFARASLVFPVDGPWAAALGKKDSPFALPSFGDIPAAGQRIEIGRPILTVFARASSPASCLKILKRTAGELDQALYGR